METRYIDANKLQEEFEKIADEPDYMHEGENWQTGIYLAGTITDKQPTADVEEVKHGYWNQSSYVKRLYYCSVCHRHIEDASESPYQKFPYCHCGAKMDGERK